MELLPTFAAWQPRFGDNDVLGWMITLGYFFVAAICMAAFRVEARRPIADEQRAQRPAFWLILGILLVVLGINKQLDFQRLVQSTGRQLVYGVGLGNVLNWFKLLFVLTLCAAIAAASVYLARYVGRQWRRYALALIGLLSVGLFILLRAAASLPVLDGLNRRHSESIHLVFELGGILLIGINAVRFVFHGTDR